MSLSHGLSWCISATEINGSASVNNPVAIRCAAIAREQARSFLSERYAVGQPMASLTERIVCEMVAQAIEQEFNINHNREDTQ